MEKKTGEIIENSLEGFAHYDCVEHAYVEGFLDACYELGTITEEEMMRLYNKYAN